MKKIYIYPAKLQRSWTLILICFALSAKADYWTQKADFPAGGRELPFSFAIGTNGYAGGGASHHDLWKYNSTANAWTQMADLPGGTARRASIGFSINNKGYAGLGESGYQDLWEYDPLLNTWTQKANFGGGARSFVAAFVIGNKAYASCGYAFSISFNDLWEWDQATNTWTQKSSLPGLERAGAIGFSADGKGYVGTGCINGTWSSTLNDFYEYDPTTDTWTQKPDLPAPPRVDASAFSICDKGYICTGGEVLLGDLWQFSPALNQWIQKSDFGGSDRDDATCFVIGTKAYLGLGQSATGNMFDFWEYTPDSACTTGIDEFAGSSSEFTVNPNPAKEFIVISYQLLVSSKEKINLTIADAQGKKVFETQLETKTSNFKLQTSNFSKGIYFVEINNGKQQAIKKFIKN